jgi:hypothetical protein
LAAAASAVNLLAFKLENLMATNWSRNDAMLLAALAAIILLTVTGLLTRLKPDGSPARLRLMAVTMLVALLLARSGADLSRQDAAPLAADLRKTATPVYNDQYFELK